MAAPISLVTKAKVPCWPWENRCDSESAGHPIGGACLYCHRDVAVPKQFAGCDPVCLTCAFITDLLPLIERTPDDTRMLPEVAADWAREKAAQ